MKKNPLYPSRLRSRAEFLRRTVTVEHGISRERWETVFICWCGVEPLSGHPLPEGRNHRDADQAGRHSI